MSSEEEVKALIARKTETKNLDYKETTDWSGVMDEKLELVKDVLAMANTQDGGSILIGIRDSDFELVGMSDSAWRSFDQTKVNDLIQRYAGRGLACQVYKYVIDGKRAVCIDVREFERDLVICEADANSSKTGKTILAKGTVYMRTLKATSEPVRSTEDMRELLARALLKKGDELLRTIEQLISGKPPAPSDESQRRYTQEANQANTDFFDKLREQFKDDGHWQITAFPLPYEPHRTPGISETGKLVQECEVSLRGWNFPHTDSKRVESFSEGKQSQTNWERHIEGYRVYRSGLFIWAGDLWEDFERYRTADQHRVLAFPNVIFDVTEFVMFCMRFYEKLNPEGVSITILLNGTRDRELVSNRSVLSGRYVCSESSICWEEIVKTADLRASYDEIARRCLKYLFALFNWDTPSDEMLRGWQQKLLNRQI
jgi:hypothetical protein